MIHRLAVVAMIACSLAASVQAQSDARWVSTNPGGGGALNSPVVTTRGTWVVGSDLGGVYLSSDSGNTWRAIGAADGLNATHVASLAAHPDSGALVIGTDSGVFVGNPDGTQIQHVWREGYVAGVTVGAERTWLYAAVHPQWNALAPYIVRSADSGKTWARAGSNLPADLRVIGLSAHPTDLTTLLLVTGEGRFNKSRSALWLSRDRGRRWTQIGGSLGPIYDARFGPDGALFVTTPTGPSGAVYRSLNGGRDWRKLADRTGMLIFDATNPERLRLMDLNIQVEWEANSGVWESLDGGASWRKMAPVTAWQGAWSNSLTMWGTGSSYQGFPQSLGQSPNGDTILTVNVQFVYASIDGGRVFSQAVSKAMGNGWASRGLDNIVPASLAPSQADPNLIYVGYYDIGCFRSDDAGSSWQMCNEPEWTRNWRGNGGNSMSIVADPERADVVWAHLAGDLDDPPHQLARSTQRGRPGTWVAARGLPTRRASISGISLDRFSPRNARVLFAIVDDAVWRSTNDGITWSRAHACPNCQFTWTGAVAGQVFAGGGSGLWRSTDSGTSWVRTGLDTSGWTASAHPRDFGYTGVFDLAMDPSNANVMWAAVTGRGFYRSADGGNRWTLQLPDRFARTAAYAKDSALWIGSSSAVHAGSYSPDSLGVRVSRDGGRTWTPQNEGLAYPFGVQVRMGHGQRVWLISPGQGVLTR
jgi:photosystem II stability/assembly factor-like uncharacterized protein